MRQFYFTEIITRDKLIHQGIFYKPQKPRKKALLWIHGLTGTFYGDIPLFEVLVKHFEKHGIGFASFNNRGHDSVAGVRKKDKRKTSGYRHTNAGAGFENFKDCIYDIQSGIEFLLKQGFSQVFVAGQSTGANKVSFYAGSQNKSLAIGYILASPLSDRLDTALNENKLKQDLEFMQKLVQEGKGDQLQIGYHFFPITPSRYLSLLKPNTLEDQFDYGDKNPKMKYFSKIKKPLLVIFGEKDEYRDRPIKNIKQVFDKFTRSKNYKSVIISNASHGFDGQEHETAQIITDWVNSL